MSKVNLYANLAPYFWKISHGNDCISETEAAAFEKRRVVVVHKDTVAKGKSKVSQGEDFMAAMKNGDFFYLCRGNSIRLLGRIDSDEIDENPAFSTKGKDEYKKADFLKDVYMTDSKFDQLHGNQIAVKTLDLNLPFKDIAKQLDGIAKAYFDCKKYQTQKTF